MGGATGTIIPDYSEPGNNEEVPYTCQSSKTGVSLCSLGYIIWLNSISTLDGYLMPNPVYTSMSFKRTVGW